MGLQITAYNRLELVNDSKEHETEYFSENPRVITLFNNPEFPYHISGLEDQVLYQVKGQEFTFRSGNTKSFKDWKEWLARVGGYDNLSSVWKTKNLGPFVEFLRFSDREGCIGPIISKKLAYDFSDYEEKAIDLSTELPYSLEFYRNWKKAFTIASKENGVVMFK